jgi:hypothetical protein
VRTTVMRRATSVVAVIVGGLVAACFTKPGAPGGTDSDGGVTNDGRLIVDAPAGACTVYGFDTPQGGCNFGVLEVGSANTSSSRLHLTASFSGSATSTARCVASSMDVRRATLDMATVPLALGATHLWFFLEIEGVRYGAELTSSSGSNTMYSTCDTSVQASVAWFPSMRYIRLLMVTTKITVQYSTNATQWMDLGSCTVPEQQAEVALEVERVGSGAQVTASYESLEICE